jgi:hypothetical protein
MTSLSSLDNFKQALTSKGLLTRIRLAREYVRRAYGVLHTIRVSCRMLFDEVISDISFAEDG